jgi:hypothetical protein
MEEKMNELEQTQEKLPKKRTYTPPTLTVYGTLTELTAAGTKPVKEQNKFDHVNRL